MEIMLKYPAVLFSKKVIKSKNNSIPQTPV